VASLVGLLCTLNSVDSQIESNTRFQALSLQVKTWFQALCCQFFNLFRCGLGTLAEPPPPSQEHRAAAAVEKTYWEKVGVEEAYGGGGGVTGGALHVESS
jgi:hypothetical protein